jgi:hypothetical protein
MTGLQESELGVLFRVSEQCSQGPTNNLELEAPGSGKSRSEMGGVSWEPKRIVLGHLHSQPRHQQQLRISRFSRSCLCLLECQGHQIAFMHPPVAFGIGSGCPMSVIGVFLKHANWRRQICPQCPTTSGWPPSSCLGMQFACPVHAPNFEEASKPHLNSPVIKGACPRPSMLLSAFPRPVLQWKSTIMGQPATGQDYLPWEFGDTKLRW